MNGALLNALALVNDSDSRRHSKKREVAEYSLDQWVCPIANPLGLRDSEPIKAPTMAEPGTGGCNGKAGK